MNANTFIPEHFINDVKTYLPAHLNLDDFLNACRRPLRKSIRVNTLKISIEEFVKRATEKNWLLTPIPWCSEGFFILHEDAGSIAIAMLFQNDFNPL